jgi:membrane dipeptidase
LLHHIEEEPKIVQNLIIFDAHCDTLTHPAFLGQERPLLDTPGQVPASGRLPLEAPNPSGQLDVPRLKQAGVSAQTFAIWVDDDHLPGEALRHALGVLDVILGELEEGAEVLELATSSADIRKIAAEGRVAAVLALEGGEALEGDLAALRTFYRLGVRMVGLTWNRRNQIADGVGELRTGGGLTEFGVRCVREMNRLGMVCDVAHLAPNGIADVLEVSEDPVVDSHANASALCDNRRNLTDQQLLRLADAGAVVCATFVGPFVDAHSPTLDRLVDHIEHMVNVMGVEHVGIGSDFDGVRLEERVQGMEDVSKMPQLVEALALRGFTDADIGRIMGGNLLRLFSEVVG